MGEIFVPARTCEIVDPAPSRVILPYYHLFRVGFTRKQT